MAYFSPRTKSNSKRRANRAINRENKRTARAIIAEYRKTNQE